MRSHSKAVIVVALVIVLAGGATAWATGWGPFAGDDDPGRAFATATAQSTATAGTPTPGAGTSDAPSPNEATTDPAPTASTESTESAGPSPAPSSALTPATVVITYASWADETSAVEAGAYAAVVDDVGECTLTLTKGSATRTVTVDATLDVSTTSCGRFLIPGADLATGTWTAVVTYVSSTSAGQSDPVEVVVP